MTKVRGTGESVQMDEDWFVRRDGSMFPVSYTSTPIDLPDGPGVVVAFKDIEEQRAGRAGAARARGDPRDRSAAGLGHRRGGPLPLRQSRGARRARLRGALRPRGQARARHRPLQVPRRHALPRGGLPARPRAPGGGDAAGPRGLARAQGRLDRARHLLARRRSTCPTASARSPRSPTSRSSAAPSRRRASATSPRRARPSCASRGGASSRRRTRRAPSSTRDLHDGAQQQFVSALLQLQLAERKRVVGSRSARASCAQQAIELANGGLAELRRSRRRESTPRSSPTVAWGAAVAGARLPAAARGLRRAHPRRAPARAGRGQRLLLRLGGADRTWSSTRRPVRRP